MTEKTPQAIAVAELSRLRGLAKDMGITPTELARATGLSRSTIYRALNAEYMPRLDVYFALQQAIEKLKSL